MRWVNISLIFAIMLSTVLTSGCISDETKKQGLDLIAPVVVLKGSEQYCQQFPEECKANVSVVANTTPAISNTSYVVVETPSSTPTPIPTVTVEPVSTSRFVDPYGPGGRLQGQWFRWTWPNASGYETANRGIVVYGHSYHDSFTQWNDAWGNYQTIVPPPGMRFLAVYVHQEDFGPDDSGLWGYDTGYFNLQYDLSFHKPYDAYDKVFRIIELEDSKSNYYSIERLKPYGVHRMFGGMADSTTGGYHIEEYYSLRTGKGNAWDGYIIYLVPVSATDRDILIVGNFAGRSVHWKFDGTARSYPTSQDPETIKSFETIEPNRRVV